ncbi:MULTISPECIES: DUF1656 domain-containing protein [unclassified Agarivorans]|uniref:DUF1656 domain-containing protein n=1 Tax=unclassified Agarivorans TaxID=2636026 RepID=UPI0026E26771|nr:MULTISPECIES: DUF1656 domain-containing protein [unclassified Agarivorans]MDO6686050.1 DUF1656 domain-containing protein [Agarivorans sp. 3_MG-2023]MDO6713812.1 DUF1656 domain-containing protein [Agarivorans sp. 2_MG-2023]
MSNNLKDLTMFEHYLPKELVIGEVYFPPLLIAFACAYFAATLTISGLGKLGWLKYLYAPTLVELSLIVIYAVLLSTYVFPG